MKRSVVISGLALAALSACTQQTAASGANLIGTHDLVLVDQLPSDGTLAQLVVDEAGNRSVSGLPSRYLFVTSADTNELRVLELFKEGVAGRGFMRAPNPLETLSIPVLDRPTMLATDETRTASGFRATGKYVYAGRAGAAEISVVGVGARRQLGGRPIPLPGPATAFAAALPYTEDNTFPDHTFLYVTTWDGSRSSLYRARLTTDAATLDAQLRTNEVVFDRISVLGIAPVAALTAVPPLTGRTVLGAAFCDRSPCLAIALRPTSTTAGEAVLLDPETGRTSRLAFASPVRKFAMAGLSRRIYALADEIACGGPQCGGVVAVDAVTASAEGFPSARDVVGRPFGPLRTTDALLTGLTIGQSALVQQTTEAVDAGSLGYLLQRYDELGAYASSDGLITYFSGNAGSVIDFDARRSTISAASVRTPGVLEDGGYSFSGPDGGPIGTLATAAVDTTPVIDDTFRVSTVTPTDLPGWTVDISDGYFLTQDLVFAFDAPVPGLSSVATSAADGVHLTTSGFEPRALVGDVVFFETGDDTVGYTECGRARVASIGTGTVDVDQIPAGCASRVRFTIQSTAPKSIVVVGGLDGYLGRTGPGETFTYQKPLVLIPAEVVSNRTSLTVNIPTEVPVGEGAYVSMTLQSHIIPLRVAIDTSILSKCASTLVGQVVFGNLAMVYAPLNVNGQSTADYRWRTFAVVPSGNGLAEINNEYTRAGSTALTTADNATCYR